MKVKKLFCKLLGHKPTKIDADQKTARCGRCGRLLEVTYDMAYGDTIILGEVKLITDRVQRIKSDE